MRRRITHRNEVYGGRWLSITIAMPLDPAIGFAMVWWGSFLRIGSLMSTIPRMYMAFICLSVYLPIWARKKSQKNREGNRRRHLKKTVLNCSNAYMHTLRSQRNHSLSRVQTRGHDTRRYRIRLYVGMV